MTTDRSERLRRAHDLIHDIRAVLGQKGAIAWIRRNGKTVKTDLARAEQLWALDKHRYLHRPN